MRVNFIILAIFCFLAAACASQGPGKTKMSSQYHKKEYPRNQANINSLHQNSTRKKYKNKPGFFKTLFPGKKRNYASN